MLGGNDRPDRRIPMKRTIGAALVALAATGTLTPALAQDRDVRSSARRDVFRTVERDRRAPEIPRGTDIPVTLDEDIPVNKDRIGDTFEGHITRDVEVDGDVVLVSGAPVELKLVESGERAGAATIRLSKVHVNGDMRRVETDAAKADTEESGMSTTEKTAVGAGAGAIVGAVTGAGVLEGAVIGAGGGLAWGLLDGDGRREIEDDTPLRFSLEEDLELD
jgi:hypothetical protein